MLEGPRLGLTGHSRKLITFLRVIRLSTHRLPNFWRSAATCREAAGVHCIAEFYGATKTLQILGLESGSLRDPREHARADLFAVVEREHEIVLAVSGQHAM
jgi:hypothetical protein